MEARLLIAYALIALLLLAAAGAIALVRYRSPEARYRRLRRDSRIRPLGES